MSHLYTVGVSPSVAALRKPAYASLRKAAYLHIQRKITSGELRAGSSVSELSVAKELGSSRTPVRDAIGQLVAEGLLEQIPNRGAVVVELGRQDIIDLYELREALEVFAVGKAARSAVDRASLEHLGRLADETLMLSDELSRSGERGLNPEQLRRFVAGDLGFHSSLMRLAANPRILKVVNETRILIRIFAIHRHGHTAEELDEIHKQHRAILGAVADQDPARAMASLAEHIESSARERLAEYDDWEREASLRSALPVFFDFHGEAGSDDV